MIQTKFISYQAHLEFRENQQSFVNSPALFSSQKL